jgi:cupin 2 domain-containing protein
VPNLFNLPQPRPDHEYFQVLQQSPHTTIERIISWGHTTPEGKWYDQDRDEWVLVLQGHATLTYSDGRSTQLQAGDYLLLPAHCRHRVTATSTDPPCIWLAVHGDLCSSVNG